jgi:hypothetical protein
MRLRPHKAETGRIMCEFKTAAPMVIVGPSGVHHSASATLGPSARTQTASLRSTVSTIAAPTRLHLGKSIWTPILRPCGLILHAASFAAMVRAVRGMKSWLGDHRAEELADVVAPFYPDVAHDLLASSLRRYRDANLWARRPEVSREGFARLSQSLRSGGFVSGAHSTDPDDRYGDCRSYRPSRASHPN